MSKLFHNVNFCNLSDFFNFSQFVQLFNFCLFTGPQSKKFYERKYRPAWEREFPFISKAPDGSEYAYCKLCRDYLAPKVNDIRKHMYTMKHRKRAIASGLNVKQESVTLVAGSQGQQVIQLFVYFSIVNWSCLFIF